MRDLSDPETTFTRIATVVRNWLSVYQSKCALSEDKHEADAQLDAVLRCEARIRMDQAIEAIDATDNGVLVVLDDGQELSINASTGHINRC